MENELDGILPPALLMITIAFLLHIIGNATTYYITIEYPDLIINSGLWKRCVSIDNDKVCYNEKLYAEYETLQCPSSAKQSDTSAGYKTLSENLEQFNEINCLQTSLDLNKLNDGSGIQNTLIKSNAKWHEKCRLKFNTSELKSAQKRQHKDISDEGRAFEDDIGPALRRACEEDYDSNYMQIYKAVEIVRSDIMATSSEFDGTFAVDCQEKSVQRSLLTLVKCYCMDQT
ncbi:unnamed protein product [Mytilus coruscus]|uniref:Uncharacterized protein n=1 Tax=Mytilus coruscus TaxID=42192 RepID=A0A6J8EUP0_MYTCO|nr:unnamed protein product [Mytilus coruscus]